MKRNERLREENFPKKSKQTKKSVNFTFVSRIRRYRSFDNFLRTLYFLTADMFPRTASLAYIRCATRICAFRFWFPQMKADRSTRRCVLSLRGTEETRTRCHDIWKIKFKRKRKKKKEKEKEEEEEKGTPVALRAIWMDRKREKLRVKEH